MEKVRSSPRQLPWMWQYSCVALPGRETARPPGLRNTVTSTPASTGNPVPENFGLHGLHIDHPVNSTVRSCKIDVLKLARFLFFRSAMVTSTCNTLSAEMKLYLSPAASHHRQMLHSMVSSTDFSDAAYIRNSRHAFPKRLKAEWYCLIQLLLDLSQPVHSLP